MEAEARSDDALRDCPFCGEKIKAIAKKCRYCREYLDEEMRAQNLRESMPSAIDRFIAPDYTPSYAITAGYLGLFSLLPLIGVLAIAFSWHALRRLRQNPEQLGRGRAMFGLVMGIITTCFWGGIIIAAAISG